MHKESDDNIDYSYTDISKENSIRYKKPFYLFPELQNIPKTKISQIYLLKLAFEGNPEEIKIPDVDLTYFQTLKIIQGPATIDRFNGIGQQEKRIALEDFIMSRSSTYTRVLDAGCNTGVEGFRLYSRGFKGIYFGLDSNFKSLVYAMDNLEGTPSSFILSDLSEINYPDNFFDIVFTTGVLEALPYYESALQELSRLTAKWFVMAPYIHMSEEPDLIKKHALIDVNANRYNRKKMFDFLNNHGIKNPNVIYSQNDPELGLQEIIVFEKVQN